MRICRDIPPRADPQPTPQTHLARLPRDLLPLLENDRVEQLYPVLELGVWLPAGHLLRAMNAALEPVEGAAQVSEATSEAASVVAELPHLVGHLGALAAAHKLRVAIAIEGLAVLTKDLPPVAEHRIGSDPKIVDAVDHNGAPLSQSPAQLVGSQVPAVQRRPQRLHDLLLECAQRNPERRRPDRDRQVGAHPFAEPCLRGRLQMARSHDREPQGASKNGGERAAQSR